MWGVKRKRAAYVAVQAARKSQKGRINVPVCTLNVDYNLLIRCLKESALPGNDNVIQLADKLGLEICDHLGWEKLVAHDG
ncbi:MAG: hypothetical protein DWQ07_24960 [Chloroflexi bacterium]|nr:MAG: hypothetical protein DWQ07_24960 [Chloroflexota bacterium]MBL1196215.1 hypothetical protein [Chloroflexota bacterium]